MTYEQKLQELKLLEQLRKIQVKKSFYQFVIDAFNVVNPNDKLISNWHIEEICNLLQKEIERINRGEKKTKDLIINVPPRSLKSFVCSVAFPAWAWLVNPSLKFISASYSSELSIEHNQDTRTIIESEWYKNLTELTLADDQNTKGKFKNNSGGTRKATSTGGTITGQGADIIIVDDPINPKKAQSDTERNTANEFFDKTLITRLNNPEVGIFIIVMQRLHEDDLTGHLLSNNPNQYNHICLPAELTNKVSPKEYEDYYIDGLLFPTRFSHQYLKTLKTGLGSFGYAGQILQQPVPDDGGMIKNSWLKVVEPMHTTEPVHFYLDTAYTDKQTNDATAILCCYKKDNDIIVKNCVNVRLEFPELIKYLEKYVIENKYNHLSKINIEPKASGLSIIQYLKRSTPYNIKQAPTPRDDKKTRVSTTLPFIESGRLLIEKGTWNDEFIEQLCNFPNAKHDDMVDTCIMAINDLTKKGGAIVL